MKLVHKAFCIFLLQFFRSTAFSRVSSFYPPIHSSNGIGTPFKHVPYFHLTVSFCALISSTIICTSECAGSDTYSCTRHPPRQKAYWSSQSSPSSHSLFLRSHRIIVSCGFLNAVILNVFGSMRPMNTYNKPISNKCIQL